MKKIEIKNLTPDKVEIEVKVKNVHAQQMGRLSAMKRKDKKEHVVNMAKKRWQNKPKKKESSTP